MSKQHDLISPLCSFFDFPFSEKNSWEVDFPRLSSGGLEVSEDSGHVYVKAHLPGLSLEEIDVFFEKGVLSIQGERKEDDTEKKYYRKAPRGFSYQIRIPCAVNEEQEPNAVYENGVMAVTFTKASRVPAKKIQIKKG